MCREFYLNFCFKEPLAAAKVSSNGQENKLTSKYALKTIVQLKIFFIPFQAESAFTFDEMNSSKPVIIVIINNFQKYYRVRYVLSHLSHKAVAEQFTIKSD